MKRFLFISSVVFLTISGSFAQSNQTATHDPIKEIGLIGALEINGLSTDEFVKVIETRGVDFEVTADTERRLRAAGATTPIIEACKANFRDPNSSRPANAPTSSASRKSDASQKKADKPSPIKATKPITEPEVVGLLIGGVTSDQVEKIVADRGAGFTLDKTTAAAIRTAGGSAALLLTIAEYARNRSDGGNQSDAQNPASAQSGSPVVAQPSAAERRMQRVVTKQPPSDPRIAGEWVATGIVKNPENHFQTVSLSFSFILSVKMNTSDFGDVTGTFVDEGGSHDLGWISGIGWSQWLFGRELELYFYEDGKLCTLTGNYKDGKLTGFFSIPVGDHLWGGNFEATKKQR